MLQIFKSRRDRQTKGSGSFDSQIVFWAILSTVLPIFGCNPAGPEEQEVLVFAASSTTEVVEDVCDSFDGQFGTKTITGFASTGTLANQILKGANAEILITANLEWGDRLHEAGLIVESKILCKNQLVVLSLATNEGAGRPNSLDDLANERIERIAIGDPGYVPAGIYAKKAMVNAGIWDEVEQKLVFGSNIRHSLAQLGTGAADVGIVYRTDARLAEGANAAFEIDQLLTGPIDYAIYLLAGSNHNAKQLFDFFDSSAAMEMFKRHGFETTIPENK